MLTHTEMKVASAVLLLASDSFGNHGCNDFDLANIIPDPVERNMFVSRVYEWNGERAPEDTGEPDWRVQDWFAMHYLGVRLQEESRGISV